MGALLGFAFVLSITIIVFLSEVNCLFLQQGWQMDRKIFYFPLGENSYIDVYGELDSVPVYIFITGYDMLGNPKIVPSQLNVFGKIPGDFRYSDLHRLVYVNVDSQYIPNSVTDETTLLNTFQTDLTNTSTFLNYPVVPDGTTLTNSDNTTILVNASFGWYKKQRIQYYNFGVDTGIPQVAWIFIDILGESHGSIVTTYTLGDVGYSAFCKIMMVMVPINFRDELIRNVSEIAPFSYPSQDTGIIMNMPIFNSDPLGSLYTVQGWYQNRKVYYWDFKSRSAYSGTAVVAIPIYTFIYGFDSNNNPMPVLNSHNVIDIIPSDPGYSDLWKVNFVLVDSNYVPDTIRSLSQLLESNYTISDVPGPLVNCPVVTYPGAVLWDGDTIAQNTTQGWYKGNKIYYFNFGPTSPNSIGIKTYSRISNGQQAGNNTIQYDRGDPLYSDFWLVQLVTVPENYVDDGIRTYDNDLPFTTPGLIVNCPVYRTDPNNTIYITIGWYNNRKSHYYNFGPDSASPIPIYVFIFGFDSNNNPLKVPGQHNVISFNLGEPGYSALWQVTFVQVPSTYTANTLRSETDILNQYKSSLTTTSMLVNCPVVTNDTTLAEGGVNNQPLDLTLGWWQNELVYYYDFGPDPGVAIPIYPFYDSTGVYHVGGNVIEKIPGDGNYSAFWTVYLTTVPNSYLMDSIRSQATWFQYRYPNKVSGIVNCPVIRTDPEPPPTIYYTLGWYKNRRSYYYNFGNNSHVQDGQVKYSPVYIFVDLVTNNTIPGQFNVFTRNLGEPLYSDLWQAFFVRVSADTYIPNLLTNESSVLAAYPNNIVPGAFLNYPFQPSGTVLGNGNGFGNPSLLTGWYNNMLVYYFDFGESVGFTIPIWVFKNPSADSPYLHNIINSIPGDDGYSPFWQVYLVTVDDTYVTDTYMSADSVMTSGATVEAVDLVVNCPVVWTDPNNISSSVPPPPATPTVAPTASSGFPIDPDLALLGFAFGNPLIPGQISLFWKPVTGDKSSVVMAVRGYGVTGFVAIGFPAPGANIQAGAAMVGSDAVIGIGTSILAYYITAKSQAGVGVSTALNISATSIVQTATSLTLYFTRPFKSGHNPLNPTAANIIASWANLPTINYHGPGRSQSIVTINFLTGSSSLVASSGLSLRDIHGIMMTIAWGGLLLFGVLFARYGKGFPNALWFRVHQICQPLGYLLALASWILAFIMVDGDHFDITTRPHGVIGVILMSLAFLQVIGGIFRPHKDDKNPKTKAREMFEIFHPWLGRFLIALAIVQFYLGVHYIGTWPIGVFIGFGIFHGVILLGIIIAEVRRCVSSGGEGYNDM